ncbi:MAG: hypothetical protein ACP5OA_02715 [Candidatus Woesearchaeota archaeon]
MIEPPEKNEYKKKYIVIDRKAKEYMWPNCNGLPIEPYPMRIYTIADFKRLVELIEKKEITKYSYV